MNNKDIFLDLCHIEYSKDPFAVQYSFHYLKGYRKCMTYTNLSYPMFYRYRILWRNIYLNQVHIDLSIGHIILYLADSFDNLGQEKYCFALVCTLHFLVEIHCSTKGTYRFY